ncbi:MAG: YadA C-terminal domain-containing protein [Sinobacteraceae bacterium]|nr:YadA C-terminal domain-containing protein [Nevskiaceae bacterium]
MPGKQWVGTALGGYGGESAIGVGYAYRANAHLSFGAGLSTSFQNDEGAGGIAYRVQMGWGW